MASTAQVITVGRKQHCQTRVGAGPLACAGSPALPPQSLPGAATLSSPVYSPLCSMTMHHPQSQLPYIACVAIPAPAGCPGSLTWLTALQPLSFLLPGFESYIHELQTSSLWTCYLQVSSRFHTDQSQPRPYSNSGSTASSETTSIGF